VYLGCSVYNCGYPIPVSMLRVNTRVETQGDRTGGEERLNSWSGAARNTAPMSARCTGGRVENWAAQCLLAVQGWVRVDAWAGAASGGSFRVVALVAVSGVRLLLLGGRVGSENVPNYAYTQDGQELGASAGACRAGSLACARFRPLSAPPRTLVCTSAPLPSCIYNCPSGLFFFTRIIVGFVRPI
jgi:hypothetical protein